jgi:hypothetical protein
MRGRKIQHIENFLLCFALKIEPKFGNLIHLGPACTERCNFSAEPAGVGVQTFFYQDLSRE